MKANYFPLWALAGSASAYLATTTRYYDGQEGACGCGGSSGLDSWQVGSSSTGFYTAAGSQALFDTDGSSWCGGGCGKCYNLTSTGTSACNGCGEGGVAGESIIVMVTNLCPYNGNEKWCPSVGSKNDYGYSYHFDIMAESEVFGDNVVVNFEPVACPGQATSDWETCVCYGQTDTDSTPAGFSTVAGSSEPTATSSTSTAAASSKTSTTLVISTTPVKEVASSSTSSTSTVKPVTETSPAAVAPTSTVPSVPEGAATTSTYSLTLTTVVTETITVWETPTSTSGSSAAVQTLYGQCGGINWTGATTCATGATCKVQNPYYYQCVSSSN
ncbi:endoglucanase-5 precursor, putative [Talaromyces stipitatus ATCC 10500]|uniref:Cellulase n=1 Tax=Talaromyces stipitatus (strain ATCC 10500 / CBS 375.48 / QM 6759 / NRRL 1006) TaxID=441959 RepID=B8MG28_TALSN|nr:endoglucanase-5 precursor, putative [Talaromyces stipitatus ATCC 10500]EED15895.1 endoglucanase-5 precursor, putative [Talaromyces stipitatus ATCC 10500]